MERFLVGDGPELAGGMHDGEVPGGNNFGLDVPGGRDVGVRSAENDHGGRMVVERLAL